MHSGFARFLKIEYSGKNGVNGLRLTWKTDGRLGSIMERQVCVVIFSFVLDFHLCKFDIS